MTTTIKYIGSNSKYAELPVTGKQSLWQTGQQEERPDAEANLLLATGLFSAIELPVTAQTNPVTGLVELNAGGAPIAVTGGSGVAVNTLQENQYTKALYFGRTIQQTGSVHDFSRNNNDLIFGDGITNAEVYNTEAGVLSVPALAGKCLQVDPAKFAWQLQNGESLLMQMRFKVSDIAAIGHPFGNSAAAAQPGMLFNVNSGGGLILNMKIGSAAGIGMQAVGVMANNTFVNMTIWVDGATRILNGWVNGVQPSVWTNIQLLADGGGSFSTQAATPLAFQFGGSGSPTFPSSGNPTVSRASRFEAIRLLTLPGGKMLQNAAMLDWKFNGQPISLLSDADIAVV